MLQKGSDYDSHYTIDETQTFPFSFRRDKIGVFGEIFKGKSKIQIVNGVPTGTEIAVEDKRKCFKSSVVLASFFGDFEILTSLKHPSILSPIA
jgi:hypothetical protein